MELSVLIFILYIIIGFGLLISSKSGFEAFPIVFLWPIVVVMVVIVVVFYMIFERKLYDEDDELYNIDEK